MVAIGNDVLRGALGCKSAEEGAQTSCNVRQLYVAQRKVNVVYQSPGDSLAMPLSAILENNLTGESSRPLVRWIQLEKNDA